MRSVMTHQFSRVPHANIQRSTFRRDFGYKTTLDSGYLVPIYVDEALPGDTFQMKGTLFGRFSTPIVPIMDNVFLETFFFAVPYRLVWDHWVNFMGEQKNPGDSTDYVIPYIAEEEETAEGTIQVGSLGDYFGLPTGCMWSKVKPSALFFRAYNLIWNEWFRNENLQDSAPVPTGDGPDYANDYPLRRRCKRPDYFTSCLPWPQKGPGVEISLGSWAPVVTRTDAADTRVSGADNLGLFWSWKDGTVAKADGQYGFSVYAGSEDTAGSQYQRYGGATYAAMHEAGKYEAPDNKNPIRPRNLWADLSRSQSVTINTLRQAFQIQKLMESFARGGSRYIEVIRACFGVISPDARLQRPEYLGGGHSQIHFAPVTQTSSTDQTTPQGNMAAYGVVGGAGHGFTKSFTEHCIIIGLVNVRCDLNYQQGLPRMFSKKTKLDFYWPTLAHLGEQAVLNKEIYFSDDEAVDEAVFGYQERYAEYRYYPSKITGKFRSSDPQSLDVWHLAQDFANLPQLNSEFIEDRPPVKRILAVQDEPELLLDCYFQNISTRPMPLYGTPGLVDHF